MDESRIRQYSISVTTYPIMALVKVFFSFSATGNKWYRCGYADYCGHDSDCCLPGLNCKNNFCDHN